MNKPSSIEEKFAARHKSILFFKGDGQEAIPPSPNIKFTLEFGIGYKFDRVVQSLLNTLISGCLWLDVILTIQP